MRIARTTTILLAVLLLTLVAIGCSSGPVSISKATLAKNYDSSKGQAVDPTSTFSPSDHVFYLVVNPENPKQGTKVGAVWTAIQAGDWKDKQLNTYDITLNGNESVVDFTISNSNDWPTGQYKVDVLLDGNKNQTLNFAVQ